jgi:hypothetical protein
MRRRKEATLDRAYRHEDGSLKPDKNRFELLRRVWTPGREVEEFVHKLDPGTELDSMVRDMFARIIEAAGPITLDLSYQNTGNICWEIVTDAMGKQQVTIWHQK